VVVVSALVKGPFGELVFKSRGGQVRMVRVIVFMTVRTRLGKVKYRAESIMSVLTP
jgi:hypothetical protein